ncbi:PaaI family thioesterase [Chryseobacterium taeanense]|uniref:PaaI family thioesterase n=1 Tax=Chryseobacterium taeanense TaxID=311334 RepID=UPI0035AF9F4A
MSDERKAQLLESFGRSKIMQLFGAEVTGIADGYFEITVPKQDFMARPAGMFNGSTIASLVDVSSGYAGASAKPEDSYFTTVELKVNYLNPAIGEKLVAKALVIKNGKVLTVVRSDVFAVSAEGKELIAATSLVTLMQLSKKSPDKQID